MNRRFTLPEWAGRAIACFFGAVVLALMVGPQQGSRDDYGLTFRHQGRDFRLTDVHGKLVQGILA